MASQLGETLDNLKKIKELLREDRSSLPPTPPSEREAALTLALEELRLIYGRLDDSFATVKLRILTFLGAAFALLSYLYAGGDLFIPPERYGRVFYFLGLGLIISSVSWLIQALKPAPWSVPIESQLHKVTRHNTRLLLLETLVEEYVDCMSANIGRYERQVSYMRSAFFQLLCGAILLLVIKSIGG